MTYVPVPYVNPYVKKEDGPEFFKNHKRGIMIIAILYTIIPLFFIFMLSVRILQLSNAVNGVAQDVFFGTVFLLASAVIYLVLTLPLLSSKEYEQRFFKKLGKYSRGEMILVSQLIDQKRLNLAVLTYLLTLFIGLAFYIIPVFMLSGN